MIKAPILLTCSIHEAQTLSTQEGRLGQTAKPMTKLNAARTPNTGTRKTVRPKQEPQLVAVCFRLAPRLAP